METQESRETLLARIDALPESSECDSAAVRLERWNWRPELLIPVEGFARISKGSLRKEVLSVLDADGEEILRRAAVVDMDPSRIRATQATMLVNAAELLWGLRADDPEAWDQVSELYDDD